VATLTTTEVRAMDPFSFMALMGKRVIHPGGRATTDRLLQLAAVTPDERVLDIGCGVGTTAIRLAREYDAHVVAADNDPLMCERAHSNVAAAGVDDQVSVQSADIEALPYPDDSFDVVIAEAVASVVDPRCAAAEMARVTRPGGRVMATEFSWHREPPGEVRELMLSEVCPGLHVDDVAGWAAIYAAAGLVDVHTGSGACPAMTPRGFIADEGAGTPLIFARVLARPAYLRRMSWLMPRMLRVAPYVGYVLVSAQKPGARAVEAP